MRELLGYIGESYKRRLFVGCLTTLIGGPVMCGCLFLLFTVLLPAMDALARNGDGNTAGFVLVGIGLVSLVIMLVIPIGLVLFTTHLRARSLDEIFTPLGLTGSMYLIRGRHYQGQIAGREVDVYIYRGPTIEVRVKTGVPTRALIFRRDSIPVIAGATLNKHPMETLPGLEDYAIFPLDEAWTRALMSDPQAIQAVKTLMGVGAEWAISRKIEIQPGEVLLHLYRSNRMFFSAIPLEAARTWLNALLALAHSAENQPAPAQTAEPFQADLRQSRQRINKIQTYVIAFIVFGMPLCFILIGVLVFVLITLFG